MSTIDRIENEIILHGRKNNQAWFSPHIGVIPGGGKNGCPEVILSVMQLIGNDYGPLHFLRTTDLGKTWTPPMESQNLFKIPLEDDIFEGLQIDVGPIYHKKSGKLIVIGPVTMQRDSGGQTNSKSTEHVKDRQLGMGIGYAVWNNKVKDFQPWKKIQFQEKLVSSDDIIRCYSNQSLDDDGSILVPFYSLRKGWQRGDPEKAGTFRCEFNGKDMVNIDFGNTVETGAVFAVAEPSVVKFNNIYFMTIRSESKDFKMYHAVSKDGLNWEDFSPWCWDDGTVIETENTQQHWLKHKNSLYLVYTRKSNLSNGVLRSRAPLFMAKVDVKTLRLIRKTEVIVFPEKGARMGNFSVINVTEDESWIVTGEWLQGMFPDKKGTRFYVKRDNINYIRYIGNLLLARIHWAS